MSSNGHMGLTRLGLDLGTFAVKGVLIDGEKVKKVTVPTAGSPVEAAQKCLFQLLDDRGEDTLYCGLTGANAYLIAKQVGVKPLLEIEALQAGLNLEKLEDCAVLSLGHENMYYVEIGPGGTVLFFNRNGQCAAGSGAFWYQQAHGWVLTTRSWLRLPWRRRTSLKSPGAVPSLPSPI